MRPTSILLSTVALLSASCLLTGCPEKKGLSVTQITPDRGPYLGGDPVHIFGTGFSTTQGMVIYFGKNKARAPVIKESGEIIVEPPAGTIGETVDVEIDFDDSRKLVSPKASSLSRNCFAARTTAAKATSGAGSRSKIRRPGISGALGRQFHGCSSSAAICASAASPSTRSISR